PAPLTQVEEAALQPHEVFKECDSCPEMIVIPGGSFVMGSPETEYGHRPSEKPQHTVTIARNLAVGGVEVTVRQYLEFLNESVQQERFDERWIATLPEAVDALVVRSGNNSNSRFSAKVDYEEYPITFVSWRGATEYAKWLSRRTQAEYRLLSEAEWE